MDKYFQIGEFVFRLIYPEGITPPPNFLLFETEKRDVAYTYWIRVSESLTEPQGRIVAKRPDLAVYWDKIGEDILESRMLGGQWEDGYHACYRECSRTEAEILLLPERLHNLHIDPVFTALFALERKLIDQNSLVLHCAYVRNRGEAILFSAPSETGKTTQAGLWERYRKVETINGDRALLGRLDGRWTAQGWPVCGTSEVCHAIATPIRAIVMLKQAKENRVVRLSGAQAFMQLYTQITINSWNHTAANHAMDLIEEITQEIPVFELSCTISEEAVDCLERAVYGKEA